MCNSGTPITSSHGSQSVVGEKAAGMSMVKSV